MTRALMPFEDAAREALDDGLVRAVLLGNGFSMDYDASIFGYDSLAEEAGLSGLSVPKDELFARLGSTNFEVVIDQLRASAKIHDLYGAERAVATAMKRDAKVIQNGLADVLADRHPENTFALSDPQVEHARNFLANFDRIFTLNYDLLLYWVVNRKDVGPRVPYSDGFEWPTAREKGQLFWKRKGSHSQCIFYLHGALHLFVEDRRVQKLNYKMHGSLVDEMRDRLALGHYPLVVTEGKSEEKVARIERSVYLRTCHERFADLQGALFCHGVSMSPRDDHVFEAIEAEGSEIGSVYVGVRGSIRSGKGRDLAERAELIKERRREVGGRKLRVRFYDANSAHVWR